MEILIVGSGCPKCQATEKNIIRVCSEMNINANIKHIYDIREFPKLGVRITPAVIINGKLVLEGKVPTPGDLKKIFSEFLNK